MRSVLYYYYDNSMAIQRNSGIPSKTHVYHKHGKLAMHSHDIVVLCAYYAMYPGIFYFRGFVGAVSRGMTFIPI